MTEPQNKMHLLEVIGGGAALIGLVIGGIVWWQGQTLWDSFMLFFLIAITGGLVALVGEGLRTGKLGLRGGGHVDRQRNPLWFWGCSGFYILAALGLLAFLIDTLFSGG